MSRHTRSQLRPSKGQPDAHDPQYEWAMTPQQRPVHISHAVRGESYICPVCRGRMIARLGDVIRHHFAHESLQFCAPEQVARIVAKYWLIEELQLVIGAHRALMMSWPCPLCQQVHTANLLHDVEALRPDHEHDGVTSDVALLDHAGTVRAAILLDTPPDQALLIYAARAITTLVVDMTSSHQRLTDLAALLAGACIYGGVCTTQTIAAENGIITTPEALRAALTSAVSHPPYNLYGSLEHYKGLTHVFLLDDRRLWLPPILWQKAIGGLHHAINPALQIISQEWPQEDGAIIALYYITVRDTNAIAVRRFPPGQQVYARLDNAAFRTTRLMAVNVARSFAEL